MLRFYVTMYMERVHPHKNDFVVEEEYKTRLARRVVEKAKEPPQVSYTSNKIRILKYESLVTVSYTYIKVTAYGKCIYYILICLMMTKPDPSNNILEYVI